MAPKNKKINPITMDKVQEAFNTKPTMKRPASSMTQDPPQEPDQSNNIVRAKERWIERNWQNRSPNFRETWEIAAKSKDSSNKERMLGLLVKGGKCQRNYTLNTDQLEDVIEEIRTKIMKSSTKSYSKSFMIAKLGSESAFERALANGEIIEVAAPANSKVPYYSYQSFEATDTKSKSEQFKAKKKRVIDDDDTLKEIETLLTNTEFKFSNAQSSLSTSQGKKGGQWTTEAMTALDKAISAGNSLISNLLEKLREVSAVEKPSAILKESVCNTKETIKKMQNQIKVLQMAALEQTMEDGKQLISTFVQTNQEGIQMLTILKTLVSSWE